jgi:hypothetical protein
MRGPQEAEHEAGRGYGGRSLFTLGEIFSSGSAYALTARRWSALSCELLFECDLTCSASAELRSQQWVALCFQRMPSQSIGSRANRAPQIFHHQFGLSNWVARDP